MGRTKSERPRRRVGARYFFVDGPPPPAPSLGPMERSLLADPLAVSNNSVSLAPAAPTESVQQLQGSAATDQAAASCPVATAAAEPMSSLPLAPLLTLRSEDLGLPSPSTSHDEVDDLRSDEEQRKGDDAGDSNNAQDDTANEPVQDTQSHRAKETMIVTRQELEAWKQQVRLQIEDHYTSTTLLAHNLSSKNGTDLDTDVVNL